MARKQSRKTSPVQRRNSLIRWLVVCGVLMAGIFMLARYLARQNMAEEARRTRYAAFGIELPNYPIHGIDVSYYQERIHWPSVKQMDVEGIRLHFAFIKATEGLEKVDRHFRRNWKQAREAGMVRGAYHFFLATKSGRAQAAHFIKTVELEPGDLPPVLDVEQLYSIPPGIMRREARAWLKAVEEHYGVKPIVYTNAHFYEKYLGEEFNEYPLWVAHYFQPERPRIGRQWIFWQHSEQGRVNGIVPQVDFNVFNGDSAEFRALLVPPGAGRRSR